MAHISHSLSIDEFIKILHEKRLKATAQRLAVHKAMSELGHACAETVYEHIKSGGDDISAASVYNTLSQLAEFGIYKRRLSADNKMYFDSNTSSHMHLYDVYNNTFRDIADDELLAAVEASVKKRRYRGYKIDKVSIEIICHPSHRKTPNSF